LGEISDRSTPPQVHYARKYSGDTSRRLPQDVGILDRHAPRVQKVAEGVPVGIQPVANLNDEPAIDERLNRFRVVPLGHLRCDDWSVTRDVSENFLLSWVELSKICFEERLNIE